MDSILDDVNELLRREKGDVNTLNRIRRAAQQDEVISIHERKYVKDLADAFVRPQYVEDAVDEPAPEPVHEPEPEPKGPGRLRRILSKFRPRSKKAILGIAALLLMVIFVGAAYSAYLAYSGLAVPAAEPIDLIISTDAATYTAGDVISISGVSDYSGELDLSVSDGAGGTVWTETCAIGKGISCTTLLIAGGDGWESGETYTLKAVHGQLVKETSFGFN